MMPQTAMGGGAGMGIKRVETNKTSTVYALIRDGQYAEVIKNLSQELQVNPRSRAALSLLGYCYYSMHDFENAAATYEQLSKNHPEVAEYKAYHAQSLYKAGLYEASAKAAVQIEAPEYAEQMLHLQANIKYEQNDLLALKSLVDKAPAEDPATVIARGCMLFKEGQYEAAKQKYQEAMNTVGYEPDLAYNIAVCHYKLNQFNPALKLVGEIIEKGMRDHPELSVGAAPEDAPLRSVGNTQALKETALVEAFNLKAAIQFQFKNAEAAKEALQDMPPRNEEDLDAVTLHNQALLHMDSEPTDGFKKLNFLLSQPPFPTETFGNLLLLYIKHGYFDLAADVLADNAHLHATCLTQELYDYLEAVIESQSAPENAFRKLEALARGHITTLRKVSKQLQDARVTRDSEKTRQVMREYDEALEKFIPVLMAQAKIYWDLEHYEMVERIFKQSAEFCSEHDVWRLNVAHTYFMQEAKYREAIQFYKPIVAKHADNLLGVTAIVLANLCVAHIMTSENEEAEEIMRQLEHEEERALLREPEKPVYHLCIVNLVIGTLYCAKGNFEFGMSRIIKSLQPLNRKLGTDTWYYVKRAVLAVIESLAKHMMVYKDSFVNEILAFLDACEENGKDVITVIEGQHGIKPDPAVHNASAEARMLKRLLLRLRVSE